MKRPWLGPSLIVAGVMSGTSADGINVALVRISERDRAKRLRLLAHHQYAYPPAVRRLLLSLMNSSSASVAELARMHFLLGTLYADAVARAMSSAGIPRIHLIGCHGQTIYHQGDPSSFLGKELAATWQIGEAAVLADRLGVPVVSDFRPADIAAGGKGAPLVPYFDYLQFRHPRRGRILQNIGGIANLTAIPAAASLAHVIAFDTGPGNMVIDAVTQNLFDQPMDRNGALAGRGQVLQDAARATLRLPFFRQPPPRTAGREQFGAEFASRLIQHCKKSPQYIDRKEDIVCTATHLTAASVAQSLQHFVLPGRTTGKIVRRYSDLFVSGGGVRNKTLMKMLQAQVHPLGLMVHTLEAADFPPEAKEAAAFALLAYQTWHGRPSNLPSATGARHRAVLGKISFPPA